MNLEINYFLNIMLLLGIKMKSMEYIKTHMLHLEKFMMMK